MAVSHSEMAELAGEVMHRPATRAEQKSLAGCVLAQAEVVASYTMLKRRGAALKRKMRRLHREIGLADYDAAIDELVAMSRPAE